MCARAALSTLALSCSPDVPAALGVDTDFAAFDPLYSTLLVFSTLTASLALLGTAHSSDTRINSHCSTLSLLSSCRPHCAAPAFLGRGSHSPRRSRCALLSPSDLWLTGSPLWLHRSARSSDLWLFGCRTALQRSARSAGECLLLRLRRAAARSPRLALLVAAPRRHALRACCHH